MRSVWMAGGLVALSVGALACANGTDSEREARPAGAEAATPGGGLEAPASEDVVYVDVRTPEEFAAGHVEGALHIPYDQMEARWRELEPHAEGTLVVYCRTGRRSGIALDVLRSKGFQNAVNGGGLGDLAARGVPTTR
ncbi:MAG TPA: rhodanese-like domain-containing protein [Longimicrobiales bacterium]|nr:rhodanese-like domain-containing protein [Longimicrobiales bacterium]